MADKFSKFLKSTTRQIKKLKETVHSLKENQDKPRKKKHIEKPKAEKHQDVMIHFSMVSVAKATLVVIGLIVLTNFLGEILSIIIIFFISILFAAALDPTVDALQKYKIPRGVSVIFIFLILLSIIAFFISQLFPLIATQLLELARNLTGIVSKVTEGNINIPFGDRLQDWLNSLLNEIDQELIINQASKALESLGAYLQSIAGNTFGTIKAIFNGVLNFLMVLILTFFLVVNEKSVDEFFLSLFPSKHGKYIIEKMDTVKNKIGYWLRGQMVMMLIMFTLTLIGLLVLGIDYALTLAMMAGIAELLPVVGPIMAGIPALLVAFNESPWLVLWVLGLIALLQQIEGNILIPLVMKKAVGLNPIIIILTMLVGYNTLGIVGMIVAIPVATTLSIFVRDYAAKEK